MARKGLLGFAMAAVLSLSAAATVQAAPELLATETATHSESEITEEPINATLDATQLEAEPTKISLLELSIACSSATATGAVAPSSPTPTLTPSYSGCKAESILPVEISVNSCNFKLHSLEELEAGIHQAHVDLICPEGKQLKITVKNLFGTKTRCILHVPPQTGLTSVTVQNTPEATPKDVTITSQIEAIEIVVTNGEEPCSFMSPGTYEEGEITGATTVSATAETEAEVDLSLLDKFHFGLEEKIMDWVGTEDSVQAFNFDLGKVDCSKVKVLGGAATPAFIVMSIGGPSTYENCFFKSEEPTIKMNNCSFDLFPAAIEKGFAEGIAFISCPDKVSIEVKTKDCTVTIPNQSGVGNAGLKKVTFKNAGGVGTKREVTVELSLTGINYVEDGAKCVHNGQQTNNGTYSGNILFKGEKSGGGAQKGMFVGVTPQP